jgi:ribonuclease P protein component
MTRSNSASRRAIRRLDSKRLVQHRHPLLNNHFPKRVRLLRPSDFEHVFATRLSTSNPFFVLYGGANEVGHPRLGLVVTRRIGGAVARNKWKRLMREAFRHAQAELPALDLVCVVRAQSPPKLADLQVALLQLASRLVAKSRQSTRRSAESKP